MRLRHGKLLLAATISVAASVGLSAGARSPAHAAGLSLTNVTVNCGDGAPLAAAVDTPTLLSLEASIEGMLNNPAGTSCALAQSNTAAAPSSGGGNPTGFVVGGGRYDRAECPINFSVNGHSDKSGAHGTQTATMSNAPGGIPGCPGQGHIKATVTCVATNGNIAEVRGDITDQTGSLGPQFFPPGNVLVTDVIDNGNGSSAIPDQIVQSVDSAGTEQNCNASMQSFYFNVDNGNVTVHD